MKKKPPVPVIQRDDFLKANIAGGSACQFAARIKVLSKQERAVLDEAMSNPAVQHRAIVRVLKARGIESTEWSVARHRQSECIACSRDAK